MASCIRHINTCLALLGSGGFASAFSEFMETLGADQVMVFAITERDARCLFSRHYRNAVLAEELSAQYLDGWYLQDPLLPELMQLQPGSVRLQRLEAATGAMGSDYRRIFFDEPGLRAKTTVLAAGERLKLFVSLYQTGGAQPEADAELARIAGRLALMHFERVADSATPPALDALSERERAVCLGILAGQKAEVIAAELEVAPNTVITYRKRAYAKLGINSRAGLFALCRDPSSSG
ncbi:helix-turn-helix transcriptional regulator [Leisingera sp.]|jgi:DNA-binding CsgD family transcriptional regulator|uniref:helix-turn-helix transcriptional regulator n=1 Tax=Leisingera sp. TaxID=1879318 RepID=UPI003A954ADE